MRGMDLDVDVLGGLSRWEEFAGGRRHEGCVWGEEFRGGCWHEEGVCFGAVAVSSIIGKGQGGHGHGHGEDCNDGFHLGWCFWRVCSRLCG